MLQRCTVSVVTAKWAPKLKLDFYAEQCQGHALAAADMFRRCYGSDLFHSLLPATRGCGFYFEHMEQSLLQNEITVVCCGCGY